MGAAFFLQSFPLLGIGDGRITVDMEKLPNLANAIVLCEKEYAPFLYAYKASHPDQSFKIWGKDDLLDRLSFTYKNDPVPAFLKKGISYSNAKKFLSILRIADNEKNEKLCNLMSELREGDFLQEDDLGLFEVKRHPLFLLELDEDFELKSFLDRKGLPYQLLSLEDLGALEQNKIGDMPPVYLFPNKFYQFNYIFSYLRKEILQNPEEKDSFQIVCHDDSDCFYAQIASDLFKLPCSLNLRIPFLSDPSVKEKVSWIRHNRSFAFTEEEKKNPSLSSFAELVEHYGFSQLEFGFAYASMLELFSSLATPVEKVPGVALTRDCTIDPGKIYLVANFQDGDFYSSFSDKNVLSDLELVAVGANPSYVKTELDKRKKINFIRYNRIAFLSRPIQHLNDKIYDSPFVKEGQWKGEFPISKVRWNQEGNYPEEAEKIYRADCLDHAFYRKPYDGLLGYDHQFKKGDKSLYPEVRRHSATRLERYISCPFKFLLDAYFPADVSSLSSRLLGVLNHAMMTSLYGQEDDFDRRFDEEAEKYKNSYIQEAGEFPKQEEVSLRIYKHWLRRVFSEIRDVGVGHLTSPKEIAEQPVLFALKDGDGKEYPFSGRIDKLLFTGTGDKRYYTIIDYKSGGEKFQTKHIFLGPSIQLPLYYLALQQGKNRELLQENGKEAEFGGMLIQHVYGSTLKKMIVKDGACSYQALGTVIKGAGCVSDDPLYWQYTCEDGLTKEKGLPGVRGGAFMSGKGLFGGEEGKRSVLPKADYPLSSLLKDAEGAAISTIHHIENGEFPIAPTSSDLSGNVRKLSCMYCSYGDICFRSSAADKVSYLSEIKKHFGGDVDLELDEDEEDEDDE